MPRQKKRKLQGGSPDGPKKGEALTLHATGPLAGGGAAVEVRGEETVGDLRCKVGTALGVDPEGVMLLHFDVPLGDMAAAVASSPLCDGDEVTVCATDKVQATVALKDFGLEPTPETVNKVLSDRQSPEEKARLLGLLVACDASLAGDGYRGQYPLHVAAYNGLLESASILLEHGAPVNVRSGKNRMCPIHAAALSGVPMIKFLVSKGADVGSKSADDEEPLFCAATTTDDVAVVEELVRLGNDPCLATKSKKSPLYCAAAKPGMLRAMLKSCTDINMKHTKDGLTVLHRAAMLGCEESVKLLIQCGAKHNWCNNGDAPIHFAAAEGKAHIVSLLVSLGEDPGRKNTAGYEPLHIAAEVGELATVTHLLTLGRNVHAITDEGMTPLYLAARAGYVDAVRLLREQGGEFTCAFAYKCHPLHAAARQGETEMVSVLASLGVEMNVRDAQGFEALYYAAAGGHRDTAKRLVELGNGVDAAAWDGRTALHRAVGGARGVAVDVMLELGADVRVKDADGTDALLYAVKGQDEVTVRKVLQCTAVDINSRDMLHVTALAHACDLRLATVVELLLDRGADPNIADIKGVTPLHFAARRGLLGVVKSLIAHGGRPNATTRHGKTPLAFAKQWNYFNVIEFLKKS